MLGLIAWIYVLALVNVLAAEINVVSPAQLWPRALLTPFTDDVQLTGADELRTPPTPERAAQGLRAATWSSTTADRR